jgi:glycosyltransferase involved in cell wall biosynthesis
MKIVQWNISKASHPMYALRRYEDELFKHIKEIRKDWIVERIQRKENRIFGSTVFSWLFYKGDADVVHATFQTIAPAIYLKKPKKFVVTVHDLAPLVYSDTIRDISEKIQWFFTPKALKRAGKIIAVSEFTKNEIIRLLGIAKDKIITIHQGVDHSRYKPMDKIKCKEGLGLNPDEKHILVVSSNVKHKRMDLAKKVFEGVKKEREDVKMTKIGYGEGLSGEGIISMGWIEEKEMPMLYNAADVFMHTSEYEGFGLPILEAMACGTPVVVSNKASIPEVVGSYGNMVDIDSDVCVKQFVEKILENIDKRKDKKALEQSKKFSWKKTAEETIKVYENILVEI